jgi:transposase, IS30 family
MAGPALSVADRAVIEVGLGRGLSCAQIGRMIGRHRSVVCREVGRNNSHHFGYHAVYAQRHADRRRRRPKAGKLDRSGRLWPVVHDLLVDRFSPGQISATLARGFPDQPEMRVCPETIYQAIYVQGRGGLRAELTRQMALRSGRAARRPRSRGLLAPGRGKPWAQLRIAERPAEAADRAVPGHWEGDLLMGAYQRSAIITLVERSTRYVLLGRLSERTGEEVIDTLSRLIGDLPDQLRRSLAWDQGSELAGHARFSVATGCPVYFADPHSPWQRGSNENTNGLLRQYYPKGKIDFRTISQTELDAVAAQLNRRPRQTLNWDTPAERLNQLLVASTT